MDTQNDLGAELIEHALTGENTKFTQLRFAEDYINTRITRIALKRVIRLLAQSADNIFKAYCKAIIRHQADPTALMAYKTLLQVVGFYQEELSVVNKEIKDYENWLFEGNIISAFLFGAEREIY